MVPSPKDVSQWPDDLRGSISLQVQVFRPHLLLFWARGMTQSSPSATEAARRLWTRYASDPASAEKLGAASERLFSELEAQLARWVGAEGFRVLWGRALEQAQTGHPALGKVSDSEWGMRAVVSAVQAHGARQVAAGIVSVVATLIDLLGRIIGEELAVRLVEQTGAPSPHGESSIRKQGRRHG
jgi:hypothetical protein